LFCLGHADAFPAGDLALQEALRIGFGLKARPTAKELVAIAERWRPYRGVAAHLLWAYYHVVKRRDGAPLQAKPSPSRSTAGPKAGAATKVQARATARSQAAPAVSKKAVSHGRKRAAKTVRPKP
jgi:DNA-3-methyladenine glycosylase II